MKGLAIGGLLLLNLIIQTMILTAFPIFGAQPDTLLCLVAALGLANGYFTAAFTGLFGGLLFDILFGWPIGGNALLYLLAGILAGIGRERLRTETILFSCALTTVISVCKEGLGLLVARIAGSSFSFTSILIGGVLPTALLTGIAMLPILIGIRRLSQFSFMRRRYQDMLD
mgnify:CR=1 FL=1